ncbi:MAG: polyprenyl synthetase family protein [Proteobacteria bacterium]|nr:polyprenyl synthetase family protein [Pseudomonadota bacterium]
MQAIKHKQTEGSTVSPLDHLADLLNTDMKATNAVILARMQSHIPLVSELAAYLIAAGGKRIRPLLTLAAAKACSDKAEATGLAAAVEFIHTATLLHDDVVDESAQRRGQASANMVFGNKASVLVGDFLFARAFELMVETDSIKILDILARASRIIAEGEVLQMSLTGNLEITLEQYAAIIEAKTAALFAAACESGALKAGADAATAENFRLYGHHLGMAFQMIDDLIDYTSDKKQMGKDAGDDFREGKLTLPVILALKKATPDETTFWARCMRDHNQTAADLETARTIIAKHNTVAEGRSVAQNHIDAARLALTKTKQTGITTTLDQLLDFVVSRNH